MIRRPNLIVSVLLAITGLTLLTGCDKFDSLTEPSALGTSKEWSVTNGGGDVLGPLPSSDGRPYLNFPGPKSYVGYLEKAHHTSIAPGSVLTVTFRLVSTDAEYNGRVDQNDVDPAHATLFLRSAWGERWWAGGARCRLSDANNSLCTLSAPMVLDTWADVNAGRDSRRFQEAIANPGSIGVTFGGYYFFGHGANLKSGQARLEEPSLHIQPPS